MRDCAHHHAFDWCPSPPWCRSSLHQRPTPLMLTGNWLPSLPIAWGKLLSEEVPVSQFLTFLSTYSVLVNGGQVRGLASRFRAPSWDNEPGNSWLLQAFQTSCLRPGAVVGSEGQGAANCHDTHWHQEKQEALEGSERGTASAPHFRDGDRTKAQRASSRSWRCLRDQTMASRPQLTGPLICALVPLSRMPHAFGPLENSDQDCKTC